MEKSKSYQSTKLRKLGLGLTVLGMLGMMVASIPIALKLYEVWITHRLPREIPIACAVTVAGLDSVAIYCLVAVRIR